MTVVEKLDYLKECGLHLDMYGNSISSAKWRVTCSGERDEVSIKCVVVAADFTTAIDQLYEKFMAVTSRGLPQLMKPMLTQTIKSDNEPF